MKWTLSKCKADALKYQSRAEWDAKSRGASHAAQRNGWIDQCCKHMKPMKKPNGFWTEERCLQDARKYQTRSEWRNKSSAAADAAQRNGWFQVCCAHMRNVRNPSGTWTKTNCITEARKYKTISDFQINSRAAYNSARNHGWLAEVCSHMERRGTRHLRGLYAFEHPDRSVYVGLTYDYARRYEDHMRLNPTLRKKRIEGGQVYKKFGIFYPIEIAGEKEQELIETYKKNGWIILNKMKAGGLGGMPPKWDEQSCITNAKKYKTIKAWRRYSSGAYDAAHKNRWISKCTRHMERLRADRGHWTLKRIKQVAKRYRTVKGWRTGSPVSYQIAGRENWKEKIIDECKLKKSIIHGFWTAEKCRAEARKYKTKNAWRRGSPGSYGAAERLGIVKECSYHFLELRKPNGFWTKTECIKSAKKYSSIQLWRKNEPGAYMTARRKGWSNMCCKHMERSRTGKRKIRCVQTGVIFHSVADAARKMKIRSAGHISAVARGKKKSIGGFTFVYC